MIGRPNRRSARPIRFKPHERPSPGVRSRDEYPVRVKSHGGYIECAPSVLAQIGGEALPKPKPPLHLRLEIGGGFLGKERSVNYGLPSGMEADEVTGVLIGRKEESRLLIAAFRRIVTQPVLQAETNRTQEWERAFGGLVARVRWDPKLSGMQVVGWFRAGSQTSLALSRRDLEIFDRFFPEYWQFGLVLKPEPGKIAARFFQREQDRSIDIRNGFQDVVVRRDAEALRPPSPLPVAFSGHPPAGFRPEEKRTSLWPVAALLAAALGISWMLWRPQPSPSPVRHDPAPIADLNQQATQQAEVQWKQWEAEARRRAEDFPQPAKPPEVREPEVPQPEVVRKEERPRPEPIPAVQAERKGWPANVHERLAAIREQIRSSTRAQQAAPTAERSAVSAPPQRPPTPPSSASTTVRPPISGTDSSKPFSAPVASRDEGPRPLPPAPERDAKLTPQVETPPAVLPALPAAPVRPTVQPSSPTAAAPVVARSGRLIWTGRLRKNEYLVFDGGKASIGSATGALPGKPVEFTVSPGDLTKNGLVVYTAGLPKSGGTQESPGPQNGWNRTVYEWDPARTTDFEVVEAPSASNGWKRLVLRARNPKHSIVMVEWKTQP